MGFFHLARAAVVLFFFSKIQNKFLGEVVSSCIEEPHKMKRCASIVCSTRRLQIENRAEREEAKEGPELRANHG